MNHYFLYLLFVFFLSFSFFLLKSFPKVNKSFPNPLFHTFPSLSFTFSPDTSISHFFLPFLGFTLLFFPRGGDPEQYTPLLIIAWFTSVYFEINKFEVLYSFLPLGGGWLGLWDTPEQRLQLRQCGRTRGPAQGTEEEASPRRQTVGGPGTWPSPSS